MTKALALISLIFVMCVPAMAETQQPIRVKCGGSAYTDSKGQAWATDYDFNGGLVSQLTGSVKGTSDPALFQHGRMPDTSPLVYTFSVANGAYHVNLYFAELNSGDEFVGGRVFNVKTQGNVVIQNLDIFATVGANAALIKGVDIAVTNGQATIELDNIPGHDRGKVDAIEITQNTGAPELTLNFVYPDGTPVTGNLNYTVATSALKLGGNTPLTKGQATCSSANHGPGGTDSTDFELDGFHGQHTVADRDEHGPDECELRRGAEFVAKRSRAKNVARFPLPSTCPRRSNGARSVVLTKPPSIQSLAVGN